MMEVSAELEAADERQADTEHALAAARAEAADHHGHLQQLMEAQRRLAEQLAEREAEAEVTAAAALTKRVQPLFCGEADGLPMLLVIFETLTQL